MALLTLGDLQLDGFEVPASIRFGGAQRAIVHKLLGGGRVIDTMGRDDRALVWRGVLSGSGASDRARLLDAVRAAGDALPLAWDAFCYDVVISDIDFEYCGPWWIPYRITCTVLSDLAQSTAVDFMDVSSSVLADLAAASMFVDVGTIADALSAPGALAPGASGLAPAIAGLSGAQVGLGVAIGSAEQGLEASDVTALVSASGSLAQLCAAQGFIGRSLVNLEGIAG